MTIQTYEEPEVRLELRRAVRDAGGLAEFAQAARVDETALKDMLDGRDAPSRTVLRYIGYAVAIRYVKIDKREGA